MAGRKHQGIFLLEGPYHGQKNVDYHSKHFVKSGLNHLELGISLKYYKGRSS